MPQFDIFSFFSQLFWVFFCFIVIYLLLAYYLLPALSITLKVRKNQLFRDTIDTTKAAWESKLPNTIFDNWANYDSKTFYNKNSSKLTWDSFFFIIPGNLLSSFIFKNWLYSNLLNFNYTNEAFFLSNFPKFITKLKK